MDASQNHRVSASNGRQDVAATVLADLLARVEKAEGPVEELDGDLARAFGWTLYDDGMGYMTRWRDPDGTVGAGRPPPFTASLDTALVLVRRCLPGLYMWRIEFDDEPTPYPYEARVFASEHEGHTSGPTAALALLAAMLEALTNPKGNCT